MTKVSYVPQFRIDNLDTTLTELDNGCLHKAGAETITGIKTISGTTEIRVINQFTDYALGETPSTAHYAGYKTIDKNGVEFGNSNTTVNTAGRVGNNFYVVNKKSDNTTVTASMGVYAEVSGTTYAQCPEPAASSSTSTTYIATTGWVNDPSKSTNVVHRTGDETIAGTKTFSSVINGTALKAQWADLAENYITDTKYEEGTLIEFGGNNEVTIANNKVNGVISSKPALLLNNKEKGQPVALAGRVPVKVEGRINKFDKLTLSSNGIARKKKWYEFYKRTIAISLETNHKPEVKKILCVTKFNLD